MNQESTITFVNTLDPEGTSRLVVLERLEGTQPVQPENFVVLFIMRSFRVLAILQLPTRGPSYRPGSQYTLSCGDREA